jgi:hypothetical protein
VQRYGGNFKGWFSKRLKYALLNGSMPVSVIFLQFILQAKEQKTITHLLYDFKVLNLIYTVNDEAA